MAVAPTGVTSTEINTNKHNSTQINKTNNKKSTVGVRWGLLGSFGICWVGGWCLLGSIEFSQGALISVEICWGPSESFRVRQVCRGPTGFVNAHWVLSTSVGVCQNLLGRSGSVWSCWGPIGSHVGIFHFYLIWLTFVHLDSLWLTQIHSSSFRFNGLNWVHLGSLGFHWVHLGSLGFTLVHFRSLRFSCWLCLSKNMLGSVLPVFEYKHL